MNEPQQSSINVAGGVIIGAFITTDGAGAVALGGGSGVASVAFVTDGTDGLIDLTLENAFAALVISLGSASVAGGAFFVNIATQGAAVLRLTCIDATGAAAEDLAAVAATIRMVGIVEP